MAAINAAVFTFEALKFHNDKNKTISLLVCINKWLFVLSLLTMLLFMIFFWIFNHQMNSILRDLLHFL